MEYKKLPKVFKQQWISALISGEYKQTEGTLKDEHGYCCLGVACSVMKYHDRVISKHNSISLKYDRIPLSLRGCWEDNLLVSHLVDMNDGINQSKKSFKQIANFIEKHL